MKNPLIISLYLIILYFSIICILPIPDKSLPKILLTLILWISTYPVFIALNKNINTFKIKIPTFAKFIYSILIFYNFIIIVRGLINGNILTLFANIYFILSFLVPLSLFFSLKLENLIALNNKQIIFNYLSISLSLILILFSENYFSMSTSIFWTVLFSFALFPYYKFKNMLILITACILVISVAIWDDSRAMILRIIFLIILITSNYFIPNKLRPRFLKYLTLLLIAPLFLIFNSIYTKQNIFQEISNKTDMGEITIDTRTFLYEEVISDLLNTNDLIFGRGAAGTYYSEEFSVGSQRSYRPTVEVGALAMLVKGGLVMLFLNLLLLLIAIYYSIFKSKNQLINNFGIILILHFIFLFIENFYSYNIYNFLIYFIIGVCLNKETRSLSDKYYFNKLNFQHRIYK